MGDVKMKITIVDKNNNEEIIANNVKNTPFVLNDFSIETDTGSLKMPLEGNYFPLMSRTFLKSNVVKSDLILHENDRMLYWDNVECSQEGGGILKSIKSGFSKIGRKAKQGATFVASHAKTKLQLGENDCGNQLSGPQGLKVNYLAKERSGHHYFAVLMYCTVNFRTHIRFLGIMKLTSDIDNYIFSSGPGNVDDAIDSIILYLTKKDGEEAYIAQIKAIAQKKCWGPKKTKQGIEKARKFLERLRNLWESSQKTKKSFLNALFKRTKTQDGEVRQVGGLNNPYLLLQNRKGSILQRHPNENDCIDINYRNLANQIWYKLYLNIFSSEDCGSQCKEDTDGNLIDKRKGLKRQCGAVSRKVEISEILPKFHGDIVYKVRESAETQLGGTDPATVGWVILFVVLVMICCAGACGDSSVGNNWFFQHICCGMCIDMVESLLGGLVP